jgi:ribonucleoside-diphosphate reductase alpha chain
MRRRLPDTRQSVTHKFNVAGHEGYLTVGLYDDGRPGELFITMAKEGSTIGGVMDSLGTAISVALQYGVPIESLVNKFTHQRFEPAGMTHNPEIPFAKSLVDYIFRWLGMEFIPGYRAANAPHRGVPLVEDGNASTPAPTDAPARARVEAIIDHAQGRNPGTPAPAPAAASGGNGNGNGDHDRANGGVLRRIEVGDSSGSPRTSAKEDDASSARTKAAAESLEVAAPGTGAALGIAMKELQADAPACDVCGTITVRSGTCYKCLNCGNSMGCS